MMALLGERDGHSGLYTLHTHPQPLHLYPVRVYWFSDGLAAVGGETAGAKLVAIEGVPDRRARRAGPAADHARQRVELPRARSVLPRLRRGAARARRRRSRPGDVHLRVGAGRARRRARADHGGRVLVPRFPFYWQQPAPPPGAPRPLWVRYRGTAQGVTTLQRGRYVYVAYTETRDSRASLARGSCGWPESLRFRRLIVDVRQNGGGNNRTYRPLLQRCGTSGSSGVRAPVVLTGRTTFSAAGNFVAEVAQSTRARLIGEPPGGAREPVGRLRAGRAAERRHRGPRRDRVRRAGRTATRARRSSRTCASSSRAPTGCGTRSRAQAALRCDAAPRGRASRWPGAQRR